MIGNGFYDVRIAAFDECFACDVAHGAVSVGSHDTDLLPGTDRFDDWIVRCHLDRRHARRGEIELRACGDPLAQRIVIDATGFDYLATSVRHGGRWFEQHQAEGRRGHVHATRSEIIGERSHVEDWV